jgi:uncharacterized protein YjgD (DUF1641 family)
MHQFEFANDYNLAVGLHWKSSKKKSGIPEDWAERYNATRALYVNSLEKISYGVVENSAANIEVPKDTLSLAALLAQSYKSSLWLIELPKAEKNSTPIYWGGLISDGVPEVDVFSESLEDILESINSILDDEVEALLNVDSPILYRYLPSVKLDNSSEYNEISDQRKWRNNEFDLDDLNDVLLNKKVRNKAKISGLKQGIDLSALMEPRNIIKTFMMVIMLLVLGYILGVFEDEEVQAIINYSNPTLRTEPVVNIKDETTRVVVSKMSQETPGIRRDWAVFYRDKYKELPSFVYGYKKTHMGCDLGVMRCEFTYTGGDNYSDLDPALVQLRPLFDDISFTTDGKNIHGIFRIDKTLLYSGQHVIEDLPIFDYGRAITAKSIKLTKSRPGLTMNTTSAAKMEIDFKKENISPDPDIEISYMIIGWAADGLYGHQFDVVLDNLNSKFISITGMSMKTDNGMDRFTVKGAYLLRAIDSENKK